MSNLRLIRAEAQRPFSCKHFDWVELTCSVVNERSTSYNQAIFCPDNIRS